MTFYKPVCLLPCQPTTQLARKDHVQSYTPGEQLDIAEMFKVGDEVDVAGKTIGKGFQGGLVEV